MGSMNEPFDIVASEEAVDDFSLLSRGTARISQPVQAQAFNAPVTGILHGFDISDRPLVSGLPQFPGEVIAARSTVALAHRMLGAGVLMLFEQGDPTRPIIIGVLQDSQPPSTAEETPLPVSIQSDDQRLVLSAEREIVLRCGDASITLTRAGKVIIKGNYIVSRSKGYNKIKGASVDIN